MFTYVICGTILIGLGVATVVNTMLTIRNARMKEEAKQNKQEEEYYCV